MVFLLRFGAVSGLAAGLFIGVPGLIEAFTGETLATSLVIGISPALAVPLLLALRLSLPTTDRQRRGTVARRPGADTWPSPADHRGGGAGAFADTAFAVNLLGLGLFGGAAYALNVVIYPLGDDTDLATASRAALLVSAAVFAVGSVLFGIAMLRAGAHPRTPVWLYLLALPPFAVAARLPDTALTSVLHMLVGLAVGWLGASCWQSAREGHPTLAPHAPSPAARTGVIASS
ncbi:putative secreted protein [Frankia canadensis]|uniref:Putative secreted protein n=1 Tax=Frankia canadensis TaxID=1836972 RepID=A0A2I2KUS6_9ACTN|nr:hypothetical protein [Frankia canadensis]SNQ49411.1 putative secreted protein [Frankia canadensis]SOU56701.1 putative secreted protein [Frankia canadensis]